MAKLTKLELGALASQLQEKLNTKFSKEYKAAVKKFNSTHPQTKEAFLKEMEKIAEDYGLEVSLSSYNIRIIGYPQQKHIRYAELLNRLIIKQIDIKDVADLMKAVEKDLK